MSRYSSRWWNWAVAAVGCAVVVCLVGWPRPTLYALAALFGASLVLAGIAAAVEYTSKSGRPVCVGCVGCGGPDCVERPDKAPATAEPVALEHLLGRTVTVTNPQVPVFWKGRLVGLADQPSLVLEQPSGRQVTLPQSFHVQGTDSRPDASGPDPDTAPTNPDATRPHAPDQPGPDPEVLRNRVATALLARIKQAVITDAQPFGPGPVSTLIAATEYDLADVALAELAPELTELAALHEGEQPYTDDATIPTPAQWIWRWNHATSAQRLQYATRAITAADRLQAVDHVLIGVAGRADLTADDVAARIRAALDQPALTEGA